MLASVGAYGKCSSYKCNPNCSRADESAVKTVKKRVMFGGKNILIFTSAEQSAVSQSEE